MFYSEKDDREKQLRFSIRKVSFGAASVAVAALYLFMGSGAVSAAEAQAIQSNEEVAADKDSETEKKSENQQLTYAAPAAQEQGAAINTEAKEEANSSERSETITKTQSDENSVSGDSSSPKSEGEATKSEEASSKPKVRKRRDTESAPAATATDDDPDAHQTYTAPADDANVEELAAKLKELPDTVENEKKLSNIDQVGDTKSITKGTVQDLDEFGGWKAVNGGKFGVARKTDRGVFPIETVNTVRTNGGKDQTWLNESSFDRSNNYALFLGLVRTKATETEEVDDGSEYTQSGDYNNKGKGLKKFQGIEKTFKNYSSSTGSDVTVSFYTGITGDIDNNKAGYKVEVLTKTAKGSDNTIYSQYFYPQQSLDDENKTVNKLTLTSNAKFETNRSQTENQKAELTKKLEEDSNKKKLGTSHGTFTSKNISLAPGVTEYTVRISAADNTKLGMGFQVPWRQYALPVVGTGFSVTQDTRKVAKDLSQKVYDKLTESKEEDIKWSTPETKAAYKEKLQKIKEKINSGVSTSDYKTVVEDALVKQKTLNEERQIKDKAKKAIEDKLKEKETAIENNSNLSPAEKAAAKEQAKAAADKAKEAITAAQTQDEVTKKETEGTTAIG
ncbi:YSIRK-type signal peptide-containing protein, partial [Streptococcus pseudopneumoniae]|uniref:YSIRK-type signal peptide-containing protein n=1 Tax=Streptococcus pseudopneumoniae TaxID=257758 RepID=UPI0003D37368